VSVARHGGREDLARDHVTVRRQGISEGIEALEFGVNLNVLGMHGRGSAQGKQNEMSEASHKSCLS
jgi:hypothetical protein